jgi:signal transduction histidine kinase
MIYYRLASPYTIVIWAKLLYVAASIIASNFLYFTYIFPVYNKVKIKTKLYIFIPNILLIFLCVFGDYVITGAKVSVIGENVIYWGKIYPLYVVYILFYFNLAFYRLSKKRKDSKDPVERIQLTYVLLGYMSSGLISFTTNLILPSFGIFVLNWVGQVSTLFMAMSATYSIIKHRLFNTKVIATELLTFAIWIIILIQLLLSKSVSDIIANIIALSLSVVVGMLLIRSVVREVESREKIELLAKDLEKANIRLTDLNRQKSEFVSFATHQLRGPLTAMKGYASLLLEGEMGELGKEVKNGILRISDSANTLVTIVNDYLNISRIELGAMKYAFDTIDLRNLIEDLVAELKPNIDKTGVKFSFTYENSVDYRTTADRDKLKQVFANIIDNSLKYTPKGSIFAHLSLDKSKHKFIFTIRDTGVGIAPETLPHLFQKFTRAENASKTNILGTGLGLYVAKEMIEAHHGTIRAESKGEGKGSTFIVELEPFAKI